MISNNHTHTHLSLKEEMFTKKLIKSIVSMCSICSRRLQKHSICVSLYERSHKHKWLQNTASISAFQHPPPPLSCVSLRMYDCDFHIMCVIARNGASGFQLLNNDLFANSILAEVPGAVWIKHIMAFGEVGCSAILQYRFNFAIVLPRKSTATYSTSTLCV